MVLQLAYRLRRHCCMGAPLTRWLGLLLVAGGLAALIHSWRFPWPAAAWGFLLLVYIILLAWAARLRYVHFEAAPDAGTLIPNAPPAPRLRSEELVAIRASGWFEVEGKRQYYVDVEADFETMETREHIVLGRVYPSHFLLLGTWPMEELGWWYMFFQPAMIREIGVGRLGFGPRSRPALRVAYSPEEGVQETIYLACDDGAALRRVWDDLLRDASPGVRTAQRNLDGTGQPLTGKKPGFFR